MPGRNQIDRLDPATGNLSVVVGDAGGRAGGDGDGGPGRRATLDGPQVVRFDGVDSFYFVDVGNRRVRRWNRRTDRLDGVAGDGVAGFAPDTFDFGPGPYGLAVDARGNVFVSDGKHRRIVELPIAPG